MVDNLKLIACTSTISPDTGLTDENSTDLIIMIKDTKPKSPDCRPIYTSKSDGFQIPALHRNHIHSHGKALQIASSYRIVGQGFPPLVGCFMTARDLRIIPPPHVFVQGDHCDQSANIQSVFADELIVPKGQGSILHCCLCSKLPGHSDPPFDGSCIIL